MLILVKLLTKNVIFYNALKRSASNRSRSNVDPKLTCDQAVLLLPFLGDEGSGYPSTHFRTFPEKKHGPARREERSSRSKLKQ